MKIAIIGTGISGLVAAHRLHPTHDITLYESGSYIGGHTNTVDVELAGTSYAIDTGFIVYNERTYPNFTRLLAALGVATQPTTMSFAVRDDRKDLEYNGTSLTTLFAQRRNVLRPSFYRMLGEAFRFNAACKTLLVEEQHDVSMADYLAEGRYSDNFVEQFIVPMGAAIWSADPTQFLSFPARVFAEFFTNHGFLDLTEQPTWRVVCGGSREYVRRLTAPFADRVRLSSPVQRVTRQPSFIEVATEHASERFDRVIIATHSDQALKMVAEPTEDERRILSAIRYRPNEAVLHTDTSLLPRRRRTWGAWNYHRPVGRAEGPTLTYNMNILQGIEAPKTFCVTLNETAAIDHNKVIQRIDYHHPVFDAAALDAQRQRRTIDGVDRIHYCGAYWGFGFHEDGVKSAITTVRALEGTTAPATAINLNGAGTPAASPGQVEHSASTG